MLPEAAAWLIIGLPLLAGVFNIAVLRPWRRSLWQYAGYVGIVGTGAAFVLSLIAVNGAMGSGDAGYEPHAWFAVGAIGAQDGFQMTVGIFLDPLSAIMAAVVSGVSMVVQVFSLGYMRKDEHDANGEWSDYPRYFTYMSLFTASMLGLVLAYNLIQLFVFWELVGLFSYLLIGFWFHRPAAAAAAKKAFIVTRIGDFGFMLGILYLFLNRGEFTALGLNPFEIPAILDAAPMLSAGVATWVALGLFAGAAGKSAQFPLHTWLPDAMEGPTPVSSLIHAATMVAAGVFLVARLFGLFEESATAMNTVAIIGGFTAVFAAAMGLASNDIKRVLAFSTVSQLGYMFLALGVGAPGVAMFHLFNHAFFKCLLFLGAGSVHHSVHTFDMRYMGGIRRWMPITYLTTLIGGLSLAGIFPLAGFWSKDEILATAWSGAHAANTGVSQLVFWLALAAAFMTAFYIFRLIIMSFHGEFRGGIDSVPHEERIPDEAHHQVHQHESSRVMTLPLIVLAVFAVGSGFVANSLFDLGPVPAHWFSHLLHEDAPKFNLAIAATSTVVAVAGIGLAVLVYGTRTVSFDGLGRLWRFAHRLLVQRFYMDALYEDLIVRRALYRGLFLVSDWFDRRIVDGVADLAGWLGRNSGRAIAQLQTGHIQVYGVGVSMGAAVILIFYLMQR
ncbi:MAG: NADH-quinone oxidoreductase subunit L [Chloroflexi bacterium]|nr:NADH-quinone oxidoreductase subunit L [Chloroflexota bacterium]